MLLADLFARRLCCLWFLLLLLSTGCSQNPDVLKVKYLKLGDKYFSQGKFAEASILYRTAIRKDDAYGEAYLAVARAELQLGRVSLAGPALRSAVALLPEGASRVEARVLLANVYIGYMEDERFDKPLAEETRGLAVDLLRQDPRSYAGLRLRGEVAALEAASMARQLPSSAKARLQEAIADFRKAESIHPFEGEVLQWLSRSLWQSGQALEAEKYLRAAIEFHKQQRAQDPGKHSQVIADAYTELYSLYSRERRADAAESLLKEATESTTDRPEQSQFLADLASLLQRLGRYDEMARVLTTLKARVSSFPAAYEVSGRLYLRGGDFRQAIREYELGLAALPTEKSHYRHLIVTALLAANEKREAEASNDLILREDPKDIDARARRAGFLAERGETDKAIADLEALQREAPNNALIYYNLGMTLLGKARREAARVQLAQAIRSDDRFIPPKIALAELELATGEYGNAVVLSESILDRDRRNATAMLFRAIGLREMGKRQEARQAFELLLARYPKHGEGLFQFGILNAQENNLKEAEALYRRSFEANPANANGLRAIVRGLLVKNQTEAALKLINAEMAKYPGHPDLTLTLADTEMHAGHFDQAIAGYQALLKDLEKNRRGLVDIHLRLADCYKGRRDLEPALAHLIQARQLLPDDPLVLHNLGVIHDMLGKKEEARAFYEASLKIDGDDATVLTNLAFLMVQNGGNPDQALTYAQRARQKAPHELAFTDTVGVIYLKKNLVDDALDILQNLVDQQPNEAMFHLHLAEALLKKGQVAKGRQELQAALAKKPSSEDTAAIKQLLAKVGG